MKMTLDISEEAYQWLTELKIKCRSPFKHLIYNIVEYARLEVGTEKFLNWQNEKYGNIWENQQKFEALIREAKERGIDIEKYK